MKSDAARLTAVTNVFTGRPARGIMNRIMRELGPMTAAAPGVSAGGRRNSAAARESGKPRTHRLLAAVGGSERSRLPGDSGGGADASARRPGWLMTTIIDTTIRRLRNLRRPSAAANAARLRARGEQVASLTIRDALSADIPALARLHVATWNATHRGGRSGGPSYELRESQWRDAFAQADGSWFCLVIERADGALVGFAKGSRYASADLPGYNGELSKIYLLEEYQRLGLGRRLVGHVVRRFLSQGIESMVLFGDARNPSCACWAALDGEPLAHPDGTFSGTYGWRDLRRLAAACPTD